MNTIEKLIDKYYENWKLIGTLGSGSFGEVYLIEYDKEGRKEKNALKHISIPKQMEINYIDAVGSNSYNENLFRAYIDKMCDDALTEVSIMQSLNDCDSSIKLYDHKVDKRDGPYGYDILLRMEYLSSLAEYMSSDFFSIKDFKNLALDIGCTLAELKKKGYIHSDIKPANIFRTESGKFKLGDYGNTIRADSNNFDKLAKGTYSYVAPEVMRGESPTPLNDVYSLGILLYRLLNGKRLPFIPPAPNKLTYEITAQAIEKRLSGVPLPTPLIDIPEITNIVLKMCAYDQNERYQTIEEIIETFQTLRINENINLFSLPEYESHNEDIKPLPLKDIAAINEFEKTMAFLPSLGIDPSDIPKVDVGKIAKEEQAYNMLLNQFKSLDYELNEIKNENENLRYQVELRGISVIILAIAEILIAIGIGTLNIPTIVSGIIINGLGLFLSLKKRKKRNP